jgi:VanZ family protein
MPKLNLMTLPRWLRDWLPLLAWLALIFALSSRSTLIQIGSPAGEKLFYKSAHMLAYAALMWLWWRVISPQREAGWRHLGVALALTVLYAISDEIHQLYVPGRHGQVADVLFDTGGSLAMLLLLRRFGWLRTFPEGLPLPDKFKNFARSVSLR